MQDGAEDAECEDCDARGGKLAGTLLLAIAGAAAYMGADLVTGGALTRMITGGAFGRAPAAAAAADDDDVVHQNQDEGAGDDSST